MSIWNGVAALQQYHGSVYWCCCCCCCFFWCIGGVSILCWSRVEVVVCECVCHSPKTESLGVKRICTTCIHNHISFSRVFQCDELGCAWSSSVKIYDYLCKRLLITAARSHVKQNEKLMAACSLWRYMRRRTKGVNKWEKREKQSKELVWFIVFYWLIEWSLVVTPNFFRVGQSTHATWK